MTFVGDKGGDRAYNIKRTRLLSGDQWIKGEGVAGKPTAPVGGGYDTGLRRPTWAKSAVVKIETENQYGYTSASAAKFPEAFRPIDTKFWKPLSIEEHADIHTRQAAANLKAQFSGSDKAMRLGATEADAEYLDASSKRNLAMRRLRKPMNWDERKKWEEQEKKLPLTRKYTTGEAAFRESSAIVKTGPLDTPILISGLPQNEKVGETGPAPTKLKLKKNARRRGARGQEPEELQRNPYAEITLPSFNPNSAPSAKLLNFRNSWGLPSRSEMMYPEAYKDLSTIYWKQLTVKERTQVDIVQARAMEKAGYERGTDKQFMDEIFEDDKWAPNLKGGRMDDTNRTGSGLTPEFVAGLCIVLVVLAALAYYAFNSGEDILSGAPQPQVGVPNFEGD